MIRPIDNIRRRPSLLRRWPNKQPNSPRGNNIANTTLLRECCSSSPIVAATVIVSFTVAGPLTGTVELLGEHVTYATWLVHVTKADPEKPPSDTNDTTTTPDVPCVIAIGFGEPVTLRGFPTVSVCAAVVELP